MNDGYAYHFCYNFFLPPHKAHEFSGTTNYEDLGGLRFTEVKQFAQKYWQQMEIS